MAIKYYEMYDFASKYSIASNGSIIVTETREPVKIYLDGSRIYTILDGRFYYIDDLVWKFFVGELIGKIEYRDGNIFNLNAYNLDVKRDIVQVDADNIFINDVLFKRIPGYSKYYISKHGTVYTTGKRTFVNRAFNHAMYPTVALVDDNGFRSPRKVHRLVYMTYIGPISDDVIVNHKDANRQNAWYENLNLMTQRDNIMREFTHGFNFLEKKIPISDLADNFEEFMDPRINDQEALEVLGAYVCDSTIEQMANLRKEFKENPNLKDFPYAYYKMIEQNESVGGGHRLSEKDVINIRNLYNSGKSGKDIAEMYGVSTVSIYDIVKGRKWINIA